MTMLEHFTPEAARGLPGPDWLGSAALGRGRSAGRGRVADRGRGDLALQPHRRARPRRGSGPCPPSRSASPATSPRPAAVRSRPRPASARASSSCATAGWCTTSSTPTLEAKGVEVCGIATCDADELASLLGTCSDASPDAFTRAARRVPRRRCLREGAARASSSRSRSWCSTGRRATAWRRFPHTLVVAEDGARGHGVRPLRLHRRPPAVARRHRALRRRGGRAARRRRRARALPLGAGARTAHVAGRAAARALGRDASLRSSVVALGGDVRPAAQRVAARRRSGAESDLTAVYFGDGTRCSTSAPSRTTTRPTRAATCCSRARSRTPRSRCTRASSASAPTPRSRWRSRPTATWCSPRAPRRDRCPNLEIEANDVKCSHASTVGPIDDDQLLLPRDPRRAAGGGGAPHRARVLRRRVRSPAGARRWSHRCAAA